VGALHRDQIKELKRMIDGGKLEGKPNATSYLKTAKGGNGSRGIQKRRKPGENPF
jgi:hypothetical protein